jgi:hypothetical protein
MSLTLTQAFRTVGTWCSLLVAPLQLYPHPHGQEPFNVKEIRKNDHTEFSIQININ